MRQIDLFSESELNKNEPANSVLADVMYSFQNNDRIIAIIDIGIMVNIQMILTYINGSFYNDDGKDIPTSMIYDFEYYT